MKKNVMKILSMAFVAIMLSACGNNVSKVDQVIQNQMQEADNKSNQNESTKDAEKEETLDIAEDLQVETDENVSVSSADDNIDVDLTKLSSTMVYSEVYNMMYTPDNYVGKAIKMDGIFVAYSNQDESMFYPACIIQDATACCSQGLEFILEGNPSYPDGYPEVGTEVTVLGTFETYLEDGNMYCRLQNAKIE